MTDNLRDRIAAAMKERAERDTDWMLADLADVLIRELGLHKERYRHKCSNQCLSDCKQMQHRYVTDWEME